MGRAPSRLPKIKLNALTGSGFAAFRILASHNHRKGVANSRSLDQHDRFENKTVAEIVYRVWGGRHADSLADYAGAMASFFLYLPTVLLWLGTILLGAAVGWRILRWTGRMLFVSRNMTVTEKAVS